MTVVCANLVRWTGVVAVMVTLLTAPVKVSTPLRLASGTRTVQLWTGRLEVFHSGKWGTVCGDQFTDLNAGVACRALGYSFGYAVTNAWFGAGTGQIWLDKVVCSGLETDISECSHNAWGKIHCTHREEVGLACLKRPEKYSGAPLRLVDGFGYNDSLSGRLEVLYKNIWGTVCHDLFTLKTVRVICNLLGFSSGYKVENSNFPATNGQIWLDSVVCSGGETDISECSHDDWGVTDCQHNEDVWLVCSNTPVTPLRLFGGFGDTQSLSGRLEVFYNDNWVTFCQGTFTPNTARVICNLLGFGEGISLAAAITRGNGPFFFSNVQCSGEETDILQCKLLTTPVCLNRLALLQCFLPRSSADISSTTMTTQLPDKTQTPTELWSISADTSSNSVTTLIPNKTQTPKELSSIPADISSTTMSTQIPDKMKTPTELSSISDEHSTGIPVPCKIQASDLNADSKGLDNRALIVGVAVGVGEAVIGIVIVAIILVVQRYRHSQSGSRRESGATDEYCYENEDFVVENRRRNRPCPEVASETERPQSEYSVDDTYDQISFS